MNRLWVDLETRSRQDLKAVGVYKYADDVEITLVAWAWNDGPVYVEEEISPTFLAHAARADCLFAHNSEFDRTVLSKFVPWLRDPAIWYCTMAQARRHSLPGGLDVLCGVLGVSLEKAKHKDGRALVMLFCKPRPDGTWATRDTHPAEWARYVAYAGGDILAMREVHRLAPTWNDGYERPIWELDQRINARGFHVDVHFANTVVAQLATARTALNMATTEATDGAVRAASARDQMLRYLLEVEGVDLPDLTASTLERRLKDETLSDNVKELIRLRLASSKTSAGKYAALLKSVGSDGRLRGTMAYAGAGRTLRWAGQKFQPHNLPRPVGTTTPEVIADSIAATLAGCYDVLFTKPFSETAGFMARGCVIAPPAKQLFIGDFANVEGRGIAWLAGEEWKLQAFRDYDTIVGSDDAGNPVRKGPDLYKLAYARAFNIVASLVSKDQRQIGKVMELMLGYGGGVGAFITGAVTYNIDLGVMAVRAMPHIPWDVLQKAERAWERAVLQDNTFDLPHDTYIACDALKRLWRRAHPKIEQFWYDLEDACKIVIADPTREIAVGRLVVDKKGTWLRVKLPSTRDGHPRYLCYPGARVGKSGISYMGVDPYTKQWGRITTYSGKLGENSCQALCRDFLAEGMLKLDTAGCEIVLHVHDEVVAEVNNSSEQGVKFQRFLSLLSTPPPWAVGMPLVAAGMITERYHKD